MTICHECRHAEKHQEANQPSFLWQCRAPGPFVVHNYVTGRTTTTSTIKGYMPLCNDVNKTGECPCFERRENGT